MPVSVCKTTHATVHRPFAYLSKHIPGARAQLQGNLARHSQDSASEGCGTYRCLGSGHGGGGINKRKSVSEHDGDNDRNRNPSWQIGLAVLALTMSGYLCWRALTKPYVWAAYHDYPGKVSVIIPALNEEKCIEVTLRAVQALDPPPHEIIVVDGGSHDRTRDLVTNMGVSLLQCDAGRAKQMNAGAKAATGDLLCFLHADTHPPNELVAVVRGVMANPTTVLGGFRTIIRTNNKTLYGMTLHHLVKTYYIAMLLRPVAFVRGIRCLFGDQTLFCRAADFSTVGGFQDNLPIMEDVDLGIRMHEAGPSSNSHESHASHSKQRGRVTMVMHPVNETSGRRLSDWGALQATYIHFYIALRWYFGADPDKMYKIYHDMYTDEHR